jgi:hypothetical protein
MEPLSIETAEEIGDLYVDERSRLRPFVYLDVAKRRVFTQLSEVGSAPESVWNGRAVRWAVAPEAKASRLATWLERQRETLTQICDGIVIANGNGRRNDGINDLIEAFGDALLEWGTEDENLAPRWTAHEWLFGNGDSLAHVWPEGETLAACVARHAATAAREGFIVGDLEEAIRDRAKRYRSTPPRILEDLDLPAAEDDETWSDLACDSISLDREDGIVTVNDGADVWHTTQEAWDAAWQSIDAKYRALPGATRYLRRTAEDAKVNAYNELCAACTVVVSRIGSNRGDTTALEAQLAERIA